MKKDGEMDHGSNGGFGEEDGEGTRGSLALHSEGSSLQRPLKGTLQKFSVIAQGLWNGSVLLLAVYCAGMALKGIVLWVEVVSV